MSYFTTRFAGAAVCAAGLALALGSGCVVRPEAYELDGQDVEAVFIHTSDIHSRLLPYNMDVGVLDEGLGLVQAYQPFGGIARLAAVVKQERRDHGRVAYFETGDVFQGAPIFNSFGGEPEFRAMTQLGVDAFAIGNHEFDNGTAHLVNMATSFANFPMLAANYALSDPGFAGNITTGKLANPYTIVNLKGLRVGVIGVGYVGGSPKFGGGSKGVVQLRTRDAVQDYVDFIRPMVDLVTVVSHGGYHEDIELIPRLEGVDIFFGGHLHIALNPPSVIQDCDVIRLKRERDRYRCDTPEKMQAAVQACTAKNKCETSTDKPACEAACQKEATVACQQEMTTKRYEQRLEELDADIAFLEQRGCHPRDVLLVHSGAFLKYIGKLEVTLRQCHRLEKTEVCIERDASGACINKVPRRCMGNRTGKNDWEIIAHRYNLIPVDSRLPEDPQMLRLMEPFTLQLAQQQQLTQVFGYTPERLRRFTSGTGDSQLGNLVTDAMLARSQVWADFALTNTLGIRSDMIAGPLDEDQMTNVFPFENSITVVYLSGYEVQEMMDFVADKTTTRGCQAQAQMSGITATLNCAGCPGKGENPCARLPYDGQPCAQRITIGGSGRPCTEDVDCATDAHGQPTGEICTGQTHPDTEGQAGKKRCWQPISCSRTYMLATNDYIAHGGSGFAVLARNTTQKNLYIPLRQAAMDYIYGMPSCAEIPQQYADVLAGKAPVEVLTDQHLALLKGMEQKGLDGDIVGATADYGALVDSLRKERDSTTDFNKKTGIINFLRCVDENTRSTGLADYKLCTVCTQVVCPDTTDEHVPGLACRQIRECHEYKAPDVARCDALARIRAALRCMSLPCVDSREDGRIQRVLRDSSGSPSPFEPMPD
jgi:5'-nucleotidase/UDP-sugar diphosphatase